jgi:hypothetical protein
VFVAGNHDLVCQLLGAERTQGILTNCTYLAGAETLAFGFRVFGVPWSPPSTSRNKGFQSDEWRRRLSEEVPQGVDILVTHGYRSSVLDPVLARVQPRVHVCGHIHRLHGVYDHGRTLLVNAANADDAYHMGHPPVVFDLPAHLGAEPSG